MIKLRLLFLCVLGSVFVSNVADAAGTDTLTNLYYTCKVWGYLKYFHPSVNGCKKNMDSVLLACLSEIEVATDSVSINLAIKKLTDFAGAMPTATEPPYVLPDTEKSTLDLRWHHDPILSQFLRSYLDSVRVNFRPLPSCYYTEGDSANPYFYTVNERNYTSTSPQYRVLTLFRAWNIYNYFSPAKTLLDHSWDSVLKQVIPLVLNSKSVLDFHLAMLQYQSLQQDAHSVTSSSTLNSYWGSRYLPVVFRYVENKTVVSKVFAGVKDIKQGDIVVSIDGIPTDHIRDSLRKYTEGGNEAVIQRNLSVDLMRGRNLNATLVLDDGTGQRTVSLQRSAGSEVFDSIYNWKGNDGLAWKMLAANIGYVNYGLLYTADVPTLFEDLWNTDAIIFDIRNYPVDFPLYDLASYLKPNESPFILYSEPIAANPGTARFFTISCGVDNTVNYYRGKVIILVNEVTQSSAEFTTMALSTAPTAVIVGSHTAGADGNTMTVAYPTSLTMHYTGHGVWNLDSTPAQRRGVKINDTIMPTLAGIRSGRDEELEEAIRVAGGNASVRPAREPLGGSIYPNPAHTSITISLPEERESSVEIADVLGNVLLRKQAMGQMQWKPEHDAPAVYFVRVATPQADGSMSVSTQRVVFER